MNSYGYNKTYSGFLFKINNKIYISKSADLSSNDNLIELDLFESKELCFKNLNKFCQISQIVYESEQKDLKHTIFKNVHIQKTSGNMILKEFKNQNIPMH